MVSEKVGSFISKDGCKYSIDCPLLPRNGVPYCCRHCHKSRKDYVTDSNRHLWTDKGGFHSPDNGCRLPREDMPKECLDYDCRNYWFFLVSAYFDGKWMSNSGAPLKSENEVITVVKSVNATLWMNRNG